MRPIQRLVVHHSASARETTVEEISAWHAANPKIGSLAYHFLVLEDGTLRKGRPVETVGAHAKGHNLTSIGICVIGDNTKPERAWLPVQIAVLKALVSLLQTFFPNSEVLGHKDLPGAKTECPGLNVRALLAKGE